MLRAGFAGERFDKVTTKRNPGVFPHRGYAVLVLNNSPHRNSNLFNLYSYFINSPGKAGFFTADADAFGNGRLVIEADVRGLVG